MATTSERILLVENDPEMIDRISRQTLQPLGYQVDVVSDATTAIQQALKFTPDLIISDLNLPGLSCKDMLVALASQGLQIPLIVIAEKGQETDVIQTFRLGARDFLLWPARDTEIVSAVEHTLRQVRDHHTRQDLDLKQIGTIRDLQRRVRDLTAMIAIGREILSTMDKAVLMVKLIESAIYISKADSGWLMLLNGSTDRFDLVAHHNLPADRLARLGEIFIDGLSSIAVSTFNTLSFSDNFLKHFDLDSPDRSAVAVPIKRKQKVVGVFVLVKEKNIPVEKDRLTLLEVLADFASISLVNAHFYLPETETTDPTMGREI